MKKKIFIILWGNPDFYQTIFYLSQHLSKKNYYVYILRRKSNKLSELFNNIDYGKNSKILDLSFSSGSNNFLLNLIDFVYFSIQSLKYFLSIKPERVIFFNYKSLYVQLFFSLFKKNNNKFIYHNFDFDLGENLSDIYGKFNAKLEIFLSNFSDYLIFPSKERAKVFKKISKRKDKVFFEFKNCFPLKFKKINKKNFKLAIKNKIGKKKIICHLGSVGPSHNLEEIVLAGKYIGKDKIIVIGGFSIKGYSDYLNELIIKNNLKEKVLILKNIKNDLWFQILSRSKIGLCFYEQHNLSHKYMAGTSTKFNNYLLFKKPMIVSSNKNFKLFKKKFDIFDLVNSSRPEKIAYQINSLLKNKQRYLKIKKNMDKAFKTNLNFEHQFLNSYKKILID